MRIRSLALCVLTALSPLASGQSKPTIAVFPLGGSAPADMRDKVGFSIRAKLDRDGHYEPIDGPTIKELTGDASLSVTTAPGVLSALVSSESPAAFIWGQLDGDGEHTTLKIKTLDLRKANAAPIEIDRPMAQPTDVRFAVEDALASLAGVGKFARLSEQASSSDPGAKASFDSRPNLLPDGDFARGDSWTVILRGQHYAPSTGPQPEADHVGITTPADPKALNALCMNLSKDVAESNGLACLSGPVPVSAKAHYRLQFEYKSDGPELHVFVKGYVPWKNMAGQDDQKQTYERQVPPSGRTNGQWVTITCDLDPTTAPQPPTALRVDLYAYLRPGLVWFRNVQLKRIDLQ